MKTLTTLFLLFAVIFSVSAQKGKVTGAQTLINNKDFVKAKEYLDIASKHKKTKDYAKTYYVYGSLCQEIASSKDKKAKKMIPDALNKSYEYYQKSFGMEDGDKWKKDFMLKKSQGLYGLYRNAGIEAYKVSKFKVALDNWELSFDIGDNHMVVPPVDTAIFYYTGLSAYNAKEYEKALKYLTKAQDLKYEEGTPYKTAYHVYIAMEDTLGAIAQVEKGRELYPGDNELTLVLVQYYQKTGNMEAFFKSMAQAKVSDPFNVSLYLVEGTVFDQAGEPEKAIASYKQCIDLQSTKDYSKIDEGDREAIRTSDNEYFYYAYFNLGVVKFNEAVALEKETSKITDQAKAKEAKKKVNLTFEECTPYFESALKLNPNDAASLDILKQAYYKALCWTSYERVALELKAIHTAANNTAEAEKIEKEIKRIPELLEYYGSREE